MILVVGKEPVKKQPKEEEHVTSILVDIFIARTQNKGNYELKNLRKLINGCIYMKRICQKKQKIRMNYIS